MQSGKTPSPWPFRVIALTVVAMAADGLMQAAGVYRLSTVDNMVTLAMIVVIAIAALELLRRH